jgi:hypothetical protein
VQALQDPPLCSSTYKFGHECFALLHFLANCLLLKVFLEKNVQNKNHNISFYFQFDWGQGSNVTPATGTSFTAYITAKYGGDKSYVSPVAYIYYLGSAALEVTSIQFSTVSIYICIVVGSAPDPRVF